MKLEAGGKILIFLTLYDNMLFLVPKDVNYSILWKQYEIPGIKGKTKGFCYFYIE